jgi:hypothetical protein
MASEEPARTFWQETWRAAGAGREELIFTDDTEFRPCLVNPKVAGPGYMRWASAGLVLDKCPERVSI